VAEAEAAKADTAEAQARVEEAKRKEASAKAKAERAKALTAKEEQAAETAARAAAEAALKTKEEQQRQERLHLDAVRLDADRARLAAATAAKQKEQYHLEADAQHNLSWECKAGDEWIAFSPADSQELSHRYNLLYLGLDDTAEPEPEPEPELEPGEQRQPHKVRVSGGVADLFQFTISQQLPEGSGVGADVIAYERQASVSVDLRPKHAYCKLKWADDGTESEVVPINALRCTMKIRGFKGKVKLQSLDPSLLDCSICFDSFSPTGGIQCHGAVDARAAKQAVVGRHRPLAARLPALLAPARARPPVRPQVCGTA
jgi:hypothetical protein